MESIKRKKSALFLCSLTFMGIGFINGMTNILESKNKNYLAWYGSLPNMGIVVGLVLQKCLCHNLKHLIVIGCLIHAFSFYLEIFLNELPILILRFLLGIGYSLFLVCCTVYIEKLSSKKEANLFNSFASTCGSVGLLISETFNLSCFKLQTKACLLIYACFYIILLYFSFFIPQIEYMHKSNKTSYKCLSIYFILILIQQFTFVGCILALSRKIFIANPPNLSCYLALLNLISNVICILLISVISTPVYMYWLSLLLSSICLILISINQIKNIFLFVLVFVYSVGLGPLTWIVISNIIHFNYKKNVYILGNIFNYFANFLFFFIFSNFVKKKEESYFYLTGSICVTLLGSVFYIMKLKKII
ncbi:hypothetical protein H312_02398 [Anncaliia algerae PRA339]|uniref:Major facilitator superfamily (MFS) profile domain-containing protein n=1 Tax=Anncaliia algerae PRA339 TaxID=1288291 RepID=A0A059EYU2_9MICR|nr:hypothetical protein H312_02398 [Anncaliia algerae PRA339]